MPGGPSSAVAKVSGQGGMRRSISDIGGESFTLAAMGQTDITLKSEHSIAHSSDKTQVGKSSTPKDSPPVKARQSNSQRSLLSNRKWEVAPNSTTPDDFIYSYQQQEEPVASCSGSSRHEGFSTSGPAWKTYSRRVSKSWVERSSRQVTLRASFCRSAQSIPSPHSSHILVELVEPLDI
jgi:hypothetical protein